MFAILAILWYNRKHLLRAFLILIGAGAVLCVLCFAVPKLKALAWDRMARVVRMLLGNGTDGSACARLVFLKESIPFIKERLMTGLGMNCFYLVEAKYRTYSHNN